VNRTLVVLSIALVGVCLVAGAKSAGDASNDWPSWRGPNFNGVVPEADPPVKWSETENIRWKVDLPGPGHATPVVWGDRIYVLSAVRTEKTDGPAEGPSDETGTPTQVYRFVVSAHDRGTGKTLWQTVVREEVPHESGHQTASQASASPVTDGEYVWASFGSRGLYCLNKNGKVVWEKDLGEMKTRNEFGEGSSPVLHGGSLVVNWDHEGDSFIVALDKRTGEERWKVARDEPTSWATPLIIEDDGRALVVVSAANRVRAYDLKTGEVVWSCGGLGVNCIPTPVEDGEVLWVMSGYREAAGMAIRYAGARGDISDSEAVLWKIDRGLSYVPSPVLYDGKLYFFQRFSAVLSCYDLKTGKAYYTEQRLEGVDNIYASPVGAGGRIYVLDRDGAAAVFRHGETFELLSNNKLDDAFDASPVIVGDELYLRGHKYLYKVARD